MRIYILLLVALFGCNTDTDLNIPETESVTLNEFVRSESWAVLNLDNYQTSYISLHETDIIYDVRHQVPEGRPIIGQITRFSYSGESFFVYDRRSNAIYQMDYNGISEGPLTNIGRGPGEHISVDFLESNNDYLFIFDSSNSRVNRLNYDLTIADPLDDFSSSPTTVVSLNDDRILLENENSALPTPPDPEQGLIVVSSTHNLKDTLATILPRIVPSGYQPFLYNATQYSINSNNTVVATYRPLPWLFIFDEFFNHIHTLILSYSALDEMNITPLRFTQPQAGEGVSGQMPFTFLTLMDNGELILLIKNELIHIYQTSNGSYDVKGKYKFLIPENDDEQMVVTEIVWSDVMNEYYGRNFQSIFKFTLPE